MMNYKIINLTYLNEISTSPIFIKKMIDLFRSNVEDFNENMNSAIEHNDFVKLGDLAHKAKSSVMIFGMKKQSEDMKILEFDIKNNKNKNLYKERINEFLSSCKDALHDIELLEKELK